MTTRFNGSFLSDLGKSPAVSDLVEGVARDVASAAKAAAPVDTGAYRDSIHVERRVAAYRVVAVVVADDPKAMIIESQRGVLARALRAASSGG